MQSKQADQMGRRWWLTYFENVGWQEALRRRGKCERTKFLKIEVSTDHTLAVEGR